ncbi:hypothetical protein LSM04_003431 [Trypanosoma melophagium]|uniref:uncharacterized protein n=1 Tax=Trypanosoma melophagium TaxID=715481 RepID=UPI00351A4A07|nr:hypothetical protein LSM04_003431 [Trypanosoma melophagium]
MPRNRQERHTAGARRKILFDTAHARRKRRQEGDTAFSTIAAAPHAANCTPSHPYTRSPRRQRARWMSFGWIVTRPLWMHARLVSASSDTTYDSVASCAARIALLWKRRPSFCAPDTSRTRRWNGAFCSSRSVERWNWRISRSATVPGRQRRCACFTPDAALTALGAFLLFLDVIVFFDLAVSFVCAIVTCCLLCLRLFETQWLVLFAQQGGGEEKHVRRDQTTGGGSNGRSNATRRGSSKNLVRHGPRAPQAPTGGGHGIQHHRCCPARRKLHTLTPLHTLAAQAEGQVDVLWLDRHAAAVDARAVGVGKQRHDVRLCGLLRREDRAALEAQTLLLCTRHLTHQTLERRLLQQQVSGALELADLTQRHGPRTPAALRVLHTRCRVDSLGCLLALLGRDRFLRPCRLLRMCHSYLLFVVFAVI